jgi:radical SAM superfamily enzyme YgiQ (UPF0313 family)
MVEVIIIRPITSPEATLAHSLVDLVVRGDGEETFLELVTALKNKKPWKNIEDVIYKEGDKIYITEKRDLKSLDEIPSLPLEDLIKN